jgi:MFS family permease
MADAPHAPSRVREVVALRRYWRWSAAARLPPLMASLAFVLAGVAWSPFAGRRLDRLGPVLGTPRVLGWSAVVLAALAVAVWQRAPPPILPVLAALAGTLPAGVPGIMRGLLYEITPPRLLTQAIAVDASVVELTVVSAPLLVAASAVVGAPAAIVAVAAAAALAVLVLRRLPADHRTAAPAASPLTPSGGRPGAIRASAFGCWPVWPLGRLSGRRRRARYRWRSGSGGVRARRRPWPWPARPAAWPTPP